MTTSCMDLTASSHEALRVACALIELRITHSRVQFADHRANRRWSQLPGYHAIVQGLTEGLEMVRDVQAGPLDRPAAAVQALLARLQAERESFDDQGAIAVAEQRWSDVAVLDARGTASILLARLVEGEVSPVFGPLLSRVRYTPALAPSTALQ